MSRKHATSRGAETRIGTTGDVFTPANPTTIRSRRRLMSALGIAAPALATSLPAAWARPSVMSVLTPAHAATTEAFGIELGCAVIISAQAGLLQTGEITLDQNLILRVRDLTAADVPFEAPFNCFGDGSDPCFVLDTATGTPLAPGLWGISLRRCQGCDDFEGFSYEITIRCCGVDDTCWMISGESPTGFADGEGILIAELTVRQVGADIECVVAAVHDGVTITRSCTP